MKQGKIPKWSLGLSALAIVIIGIEIDSAIDWSLMAIPAALIAVAGLLVWFTLRWIDAYEPEPFKFQAWAVSWGAAATLLATLPYLLIDIPDEQGQFAALVEESVKLFVVYLAFRRGAIHSWLDGFIYGALAGVGFTICEDLLYSATSESPTELAIFRLAASVFAHSLFTGIGAGLVARGISQRSIVSTSAGLFVSVTLHALWNLNASADSGIWTYLVLMPPAVFFAAAIWYRDREQKSIRSHAQLAVAEGYLSESQAMALWDLRQRAWMRKQLPKHQRKEFDLLCADWSRYLLSRTTQPTHAFSAEPNLGQS